MDSAHNDEAAFIVRLRQLAQAAGSASALAKVAGISQSGLHRYLSGGEPSRKALVSLARAANVSLQWLATGEGSMTPTAGMGTLTRVPLYNAAAASGDAFAVQDDKQLRPLAFCRKWLGLHGLEARQLVALQVRGNSMEPTIRHGDAVLIDLAQKDLVDGDIYLIRDADAALIRRIQRQLAGKLRVIADNAAYPVIESPEKAVRVVGKVVWRGSLF